MKVRSRFKCADGEGSCRAPGGAAAGVGRSHRAGQGWTALLDTYRAVPAVHAPGRCWSISRSRSPTAVTRWRIWRRCGTSRAVRPGRLRPDRVACACSGSTRRSWPGCRRCARGPGAGLGGRCRPGSVGGLTIDLDATITTAHCDKENAPTRGRRDSGSTRCCVTWTPASSAASAGRPPAPWQRWTQHGADQSRLDLAIAALPANAASARDRRPR